MDRLIILCCIVAFCTCTDLSAQSKHSKNQFAGCYDVVAVSSPEGGVPHHFELTNEPTKFGTHWLQVKADTADTAPARTHHLWSSKRDGVKVIFGWGLGGWEGKLKPDQTNDLVGKLTNFCDSKCSPKQVVTVRARRVECAK